MIFLKLSGRLGNQMFQYAYARYLKEKTGMDIVIDDRYIYLSGEKKDGWENSLKYLNTTYTTYSTNKSLFKDKTNLIQKILIGIDVLFQKKHLNHISNKNKYELTRIRLFEKHGLFFLWQGYYAFDYTNKKNIFLKGNFESKAYFDEIRDILVEEFCPLNTDYSLNKELYTKILKTNSVCVSIRRGDFYSPKNIFGNLFAVCDSDYYQKAMLKMQRLIDTPKFIIFSDDIEWCKKNIKFPKGTIFESGGDTVHEKLRLMYSCKNFIISNSTFSWWAQYLNSNSEKKVISPKQWFNCSFESTLIDKKNWFFLDEE